MNLIILFATIIFALITFSLQKALNSPREFRYKQIRLPVIAAALTFMAQFFYFFYQESIQFFFKRIISIFSDNPNGNSMIADFVYFQAIAFLFVIYKGTTRGWAKLFRRKKRNMAEPMPPLLNETPGAGFNSDISPYRLAVTGRVVRKAEFESIYLLLKQLAIFLSLCLFISLPLILNLEFSRFIPVSISCALLIIAETYYYLDGDKETFDDGSLEGQFVQGKKIGNYTELWLEYQKRWSDKVLAAHQIKNDPSPLVHKEDLTGIFKSAEDKLEGLETTVGHLLDEEYKFTNQHCDIARILFRGEDIIIANADYNRLAPLIFSSLIKKTLSGHNTLIIIPYNEQYNALCNRTYLEWLQNWFLRIAGSKNFGEIKNFGNADYIKQDDRILVSTVENFLDAKVLNHNWIFNLRTIIIFESTLVFARSLNAASVLLSILRKKVEQFQCVIFTDYREALESSIRENLDIRVRDKGDIRLLSDEAFLSSFILWKLEGKPSFQEKIFAGDIQRHLSAEVILSVLPWRDNLENTWLYFQENSSWVEYIEELENAKTSIQKNIINENIKSVSANSAMKCFPVSQLMHLQNRRILFTRDKDYNLPTALTKGNTAAEEEILHHIVSPPYLLRDYFAANLEHFIKVPKFALAPRMMTCKFSVALSLMMRMILHELTEEEILKEIRRVKRHAVNVRNELKELLREVFDLDIIGKNYLTIKEQYIFNNTDCFKEVLVFSLSPEMRKQVSLKFLEIIYITDSFNNSLGVIYLDHLFQNYLPGQVHSFSGKPFKINDFDINTKTQRASHTSPIKNFIYRSELEVVLIKIAKPILDEYRFFEKKSGIAISGQLCESEFTVSTSGYYYGNLFSPSYIELDKKRYERHYKMGRFLNLTFSCAPDYNFDISTLSATLIVLLREVMTTIFPETHQYLIFCSNSINPDCITANKMLFIPFSIIDSSYQACLSHSVDIYIFEDSNQDMGLILSLYGMWEYVFKIIDDYVTWVLEEQKENTTDIEQHKSSNANEHFPEETTINESIETSPLTRTEFLKYTFPAIPDFIDLKLVSIFFRQILDQNELTRGRHNFYMNKSSEIEAKPSEHQCDFCASPLPMAEYEVLEDGRERCKKCKDSAINYVYHPVFRDLKSVLKESFLYYKTSLRIILRENIDVEFISSKDLYEYLKLIFTPTPKFDPRVVGVAITNESKHIIKIENGCPYHMTLATMVHELTHIWQHDFLDCKKMEAENGELLIEGLAIWAEINCLEINNMAENYRFETAQRQDVYGDGYRKILELMKNNKKFNNPFEFLLTVYPRH